MPTWLTATTDLTGQQELVLALRAGIAAVVALVGAVVVGVLVRRAGHGSPLVRDLTRRARRPLRVLLVVLALRQVAAGAGGTDAWLDVVRFVLTAALFASAGWLVASLVLVAEDLVMRRYRDDVADNRHNRRVRTQVGFLRRVLVALIALVVVSAVLLTIEEVRAVGTGLLASAGLLSVVAGLAAQSTLTNVFAGLQLAFTDALRVDDVVIVEEQFGKVEEITMTYVVVRLWDERTMVLPSTYFTTSPFENWTRRESQLIGTVLVDVDWRTDVEAMRTELARVLAGDALWDGRVGVLQVTDAVGSVVQVRALVSAADAPTVFDLRCHVREALVTWLVRHDPAGLPRVRQENLEPRGAATGSGTAGTTAGIGTAAAEHGDDGRSLFTGSLAAVARSRGFSGPSETDQLARARADADSATREESQQLPRQLAAPSPPGGPADADTTVVRLPPRSAPPADAGATRPMPPVPPAAR